MDQQPLDSAVLLQFLQDCSNASLSNFYLTRLNQDANLRKQLHHLMDDIADNLAVARLASFIRDHRAELLKMFAVPATKLPAEPSPPESLLAPPRKAESDDASSRRTHQQRKTRSEPG